MTLSLFHLHGDLKDLRFPRLLAALREDRFTGVFQATTPGAAPDEVEITREVHFLDGRIAWAISTEKDESLRAYMVRNGALTGPQWVEAEQQARDGTVRDALVSLEMVSARELTQIEKGRAEEILLALFSAREGEYRVRERQLSPGTPDLKIDPRPVILKGVLERGDQGLVLEEVGSLDAVYTVRKPAPEDESQSLPGEFQSVLKHIDGRRSIARICSLTSLPDNFVCSVVAALSMIGAVKRHQEKSQIPPPTEEAPATQLDLAESVEAAEAARPPAEPLPPIAARPFKDEALSVSLEDAEEPPEERSDEIPTEDVADDRASIYARPTPRDASRPWFLLGGGAAVGFAALFLILMGQNTGDAGEVIRPVSEAAPSAADENRDNPDIADATGNVPARASEAVARPRGAAILTETAGPEQSARASLLAGDYAAAARLFGREVSHGPGGFTIQLVAACQEATVRKAVESAGGSANLFILSTSLDRRSCYRVCWGRYRSTARAQEALRREVPEPFLRDRARPPRVTRLGGA